MPVRHPGLLLREMIRARGLWPNQFAADTGIDYFVLQSLIAADRVPTRRECVAMARMFWCTPFAIKRMYCEGLGVPIDECAYPRFVEPLPWELRTLESSHYDAVCLIHPDFSCGDIPRSDFRRLAGALEKAAQQSVPVFVVRGNDEPVVELETLFAAHHVRDFPKIPGSWKRPADRRRTNLRWVLAMSELLGRRPEEIRIAFGGMYADACVQSFATSLCCRIWTRWGNENDDTPANEKPRRMLGRGDLVEEILFLHGEEDRRWGGFLSENGVVAKSLDRLA